MENNNNKYLSRFIEKQIEDKLATSGAVLVTGPKFCGKTTTCKRLSKSYTELISNKEIEIFSSEPSLALKGETPHLVDEWQNVPEIWNIARKEIDEQNDFGLFLLTGSATPADWETIHHSGAGRISKIKMRTMSLSESNDSTNKVSIFSLFDNPNQNIFDNHDSSLENVAYLLCRGGWPRSLNIDKRKALMVTENYFDNIFNFKESSNNAYKNKNPDLARLILRSYARNVSSQASYKTIANDVKENNTRNIDEKTLDSYLGILEDLNIVEDLKAWSPSFRSKTTIRSKNTRHFVDPSIAALSLGISPDDLLKDSNTFGLLFEDMVIRDLRIYAEYNNATVAHYRDSNGLESDAIIHFKNGSFAAFEVKLGSPKGIDEAVNSLTKLKSIAINGGNAPKFLMIITATGKAYRRKDGIYVCPITSLTK